MESMMRDQESGRRLVALRMRAITVVSATLLALIALGGKPPEAADRSSIESLPFVSAESPLGLPDAAVEAERPGRPSAGTEVQFELGRDLFFDPILSADRSVSCANCHLPEHGYAAPEARSEGINGNLTPRNAPSLLNRAYGNRFMWDGRFESLEEQVLDPVRNPKEMGLAVADAVARLRESGEYGKRFETAYGEGASEADLGHALAAFVRRIRIGNSPIDRFQAAIDVLTPEQRAGLWIYESKGRCWKCHSGPNFTDEMLHNTGVGAADGTPEPGRFAVTGDDSDRGRFKTPTLRGLAFTAPYMHDGSIATLAEVVGFYRRGGNRNSHVDSDLEPLDLSDADVRNLVAFLEALSEVAD